VIVLDASAALEVLLRTPASASLESRLFDSGESLHAPHLIDVEVAQVLRRFSRTGHLSAERYREALTDLTDFPLTRYPHDFLLARVWELRTNLTAYDAVYVALAEALDATLLTRDRRLTSAPASRARIELA